MAFDGITIAGIVKELQETLVGGRIYKVAQPEPDELLLTVKNNAGQYRLFISAGASLPLIYLTDYNKQSPMTAPNFCMLLRKHIQNGRITNIFQPGLERIIHIEVEHLNEMGDMCKKTIIVEIMGKHSNIIFCNDDNIIIDSIKHISAMVSSVREVLPGRKYFIPVTQGKESPLEVSRDLFFEKVFVKAMPLYKAVYTTFTGISPVMAEELCHSAGVDSARSASTFESDEQNHLYEKFLCLMQSVKEGRFTPSITYERGAPVEFSAVPLTMYGELETVHYETLSEVLEIYYAQKNAVTRIRQRSVDLRKIVQTVLERNVKKYDLQLKQLADTEKKDIYKVYGELLTTYGYGVAEGEKSVEVLNYYTNEPLKIPLDTQLSALENAKKYFEKYAKLKRTYEALSELVKETKTEITHLQSIGESLNIALKEEDLVQIKEELIESGYMKRKGSVKRQKITSKPFHYISSDGYHMYVGKNNFQNDELTFKTATGNDWWFHAKGMPGSHVIVKTNGDELPDRVFEEAGRLAAYYSSGREQEKVEIDYIQKKHVKKPSGSKPGFVVYYTNYSLIIDSDISLLKRIDD